MNCPHCNGSITLSLIPAGGGAGVTPPSLAPSAVHRQPATAEPTCPIHGTVMAYRSGVSQKTGKPYAFFGCSQKDDDGAYCKKTVEAKGIPTPPPAFARPAPAPSDIDDLPF
jgi:hypothetical protein